MKILHIIPSLIKGGAERITLDIFEELLHYEEHEVKLVYFRSINDYTYLTNKLPVQKIDLNFQFSLTSKSKGDIKELQQLVDQFQPDIIHSHLFESEVVLSQLKNFSGKHIVHFHDNMRQFKKWENKLKKQHITEWFERKKVISSYQKRNVSFIGISKDTLAYIHKNLPHHFKSYFLLNAVKIDRFKEPSSVERSPLTAVMIASFVDKKNQQLAIKVIKELHLLNYPFHLYLLGDGPNKEDLKLLTAKLGLSKFIHFEGKVDHPEHYLRSKSIYLHTATYEPFGLVLIEAMAAGIPIVCTDGKGNRDIISEGVNGYLDKSFNEKQIASIIIETISNQSKTNEIISNAKNYCEKYDIKEYVKKLLEIYKS